MRTRLCETKCALIQHLQVIGAEDTRTSKSPHHAKLAAMMLAEFGFFGESEEHPDINGLGELLQTAREFGEAGFLAELTEKCRQCPESAVCVPGTTLLSAEA